MYIGFYIYMEIFFFRRLGERVVILLGINKVILSVGMCLSFWYYMFGVYVNILNVY